MYTSLQNSVMKWNSKKIEAFLFSLENQTQTWKKFLANEY